MKPFSKIPAFLLVAIANICEIVAVALVTRPDAECPGAACLMHLLAAVFLTLGFAVFRVQMPENEDTAKNHEARQTYANPLVVPAFFVALFVPMFGVLSVSILGFVTRPKSQSESPVFHDFIDYVKNINEEAPRFDKASEEQIILKLLEVEPVVDLINSGSKNAVWGSIDNLSQRTDKGAVSLIRESIKQNNAEVKFLASIGLEKMEDHFQSKILQAEIEMKKSDSLPAVIEYLKISIAYLRSELSAADLNQSLLQNLFEYCNRYLSRFADTELVFCKVQVLDLSGQTRLSLDLLDELLTGDKIEAQMILPAAEILFRAGRIKDVHKLLAKIAGADEKTLGLDQDEYEVDLDELKEFWLPAEQCQ